MTNLPDLPPINPPDSPPVGLGLVDVAAQSYPPVLAGADGAQRECTTASAAVVTVSGEAGQRVDRRVTDVAQTTGIGLALDARPDNVSHVKAMPPTVATTTSPAANVCADTGRPGGLPKDVFVR